MAARPGADGAVLHQHRLGHPDRAGRVERGFEAAEDELVTPVAVAARLFASAPEARCWPWPPTACASSWAGRWLGRASRPATCWSPTPATGPPTTTWTPLWGPRAGAELVATQVNRVAVRDDGEHLDTGGWVRLLEYATGRTARAGQAVAGVLHRPPGRPRPGAGHGPGCRRRPGRRRRRGSRARPRCWSAACATALSPAPTPSRTRSSTASPICPACSARFRPGRLRPLLIPGLVLGGDGGALGAEGVAGDRLVNGTGRGRTAADVGGGHCGRWRVRGMSRSRAIPRSSRRGRGCAWSGRRGGLDLAGGQDVEAVAVVALADDGRAGRDPQPGHGRGHPLGHLGGQGGEYRISRSSSTSAAWISGRPGPGQAGPDEQRAGQHQRRPPRAGWPASRTGRWRPARSPSRA